MTGWPLPGCEVRVVDLQMNDVPRDMQSIGEIVMRGDNVMDGYYKEPKATADVMTDGWLHTGDMAVWDEENYIHIVDRKKDIIISGGENISSIEVERAIAAHPAVLECAVVSAPDAQWGEVPAAFVVVKPGHKLDERSLCEFLHERIARFKMPRRYHFTRYRAAQDGHRQDPEARPSRDSLGAARISAYKGDHTYVEQIYTPVAGSLALSALVAAIPIFTLLVLLGVFRKPAWMASLAGVCAAAAVAVGVYGMPLGAGRRARSLIGAAFGLFPIGWVVFSAILLYRITLESGKFEVLKDSIGHLTSDSRLQALLIAFAFGAFIEGAAGFGTPVAVAAAMLTGLGFEPFYAAAICLLANTAPVAFGSIGIPITTLAVTTGLPLDRLSAGVGRICAPVSLVRSGLPDRGDERMEGLEGRAAGGGGVRHRLRRHAVLGLQLHGAATDRYPGVDGGDGRPAVWSSGSAAAAARRSTCGHTDRDGLGAVPAAGGFRAAVGLQAAADVAQQLQHSGATGPACTTRSSECRRR